MRRFTRVCFVSMLCLAPGTAAGAVITVTTSADVSDVGSSALIVDLPGPDGVVSFREALRVSDNEPGRQTIGFEIPEDDWYLPNIYPGLVLLQGSFSFGAGQPVTIDGTTQTAFTGDTFPDGNELILPLQTYLGGDGTIVTGLHSSRVEVSGSNSEFYGNTGPMFMVLYFGTGSYVHDNEARVIVLTQSNNNVIARNNTDRIRITGGGSSGPPASGNIIGGPDVADRNFITGFGNYGEHGTPGGDCIELYYTENTLIQNNYIGTTPDGMAISNQACTLGVAMHNMNDTVIVRDNLIAIHAIGIGPASGQQYGTDVYVGMYLGGSGSVITGNTMGLNALGEPLLGGVNGVLVSRYAFEDGADVCIGGSNPGEGNVIAGHSSTGVLMMNAPGVPSSGNIRVSGNSIYGNGGMGIDLMPNTWDEGPTPNDALDADVIGANQLQNFPDIASATRQGAVVRFIGMLQSSPTSNYTIEFFASPACDGTGFGEGQVYLGAMGVTTDAAGDANFDMALVTTIADGWVVTATATLEPIGATSEFSACVVATGTAVPGDVDANGVVDIDDIAYVIFRLGDSGAPGLLAGDADGNGIVDVNDIAFVIFRLDAGP